MLYQITNKGPARTVMFLGVFAEGETREFTKTDLENYQHMSGVPLFSSDLTNEDDFDVMVISDKKEG